MNSYEMINVPVNGGIDTLIFSANDTMDAVRYADYRMQEDHRHRYPLRGYILMANKKELIAVKCVSGQIEDVEFLCKFVKKRSEK